MIDPCSALCAALIAAGAPDVTTTAAPSAVSTPAGATDSTTTAAPAPEAAPAPALPPEALGGSPRRRGVTWDVNLDGGVARRYARKTTWMGLGRVRGGVWIYREPWFLALGGIGQLASFTPPAFGVEAEVMNLWSGTWLQLGGTLDTKAHVGAHAAIGVSIIGLEGGTQVGERGNRYRYLLAKVRVPIGIIGLALR